MRKVFLLLTLLAAAPAAAQSGFDSWLAAFRDEAAAAGISAATLDAALTGIAPIERVVALDRRQPEFVQTFGDYLQARVTPARISRGYTLSVDHAPLLDVVEQQHGVPKFVLLAFWGLETNYGATLGSHNIPAALATLAYDGRRSAFFRSQLLDALRIVDAGHVSAAGMTGSWAGAMGHMQFMPSTFRAYAIDGDGDDRIDLWQSVADAMHSGANYLRRAGWRPGEPVAIEVRPPQDFDWRRARMDKRVAVAEWRALGVTTADGSPLPEAAGSAAIVLPQGWQGPAFMVFDNFNVVMRWNRSVNYALAVAQLAERLAGGSGVTTQVGEAGGVTSAQLQALQQALNELGFDAGDPDGVIGPRTQTAIRRYQAAHELPVDGYPAPSVLAHVEQTHAAAAEAGELVAAPALIDEPDTEP